MSATVFIWPGTPIVRSCAAHEIVSEVGDVGQCKHCGKWFAHAMIGDTWNELPEHEEGETAPRLVDSDPANGKDFSSITCLCGQSHRWRKVCRCGRVFRWLE